VGRGDVARLNGKLWHTTGQPQSKAGAPGNSSRDGVYSFPAACLCSNS